VHKLYELKEKLMKELEDYADNGKFSKDDVEAIKYAASAIDHICNIVEDEEGYSNYSMESGRRDGGTYRDGGSYARGRGRNARRDSMGRYSREDGYSRAADDMVRELRELMQDAPDDRTRQEFQRFIQKIEQM
jgi:hypothetical protein